MTVTLTAILPLPDMLALGWFFLCWVGYAWYAEHRRSATLATPGRPVTEKGPP